jgi:hypothetical protein
MDCVHGKPLAECQLCETVNYTLDQPETAAREILRLRNIETAARELVVKFDVLVGALTVDDPARRVDDSIDPYLS